MPVNSSLQKNDTVLSCFCLKHERKNDRHLTREGIKTICNNRMNKNSNNNDVNGKERNGIQRAKEKLVKLIQNGTFGDYSTVTLGNENTIEIVDNNKGGVQQLTVSIKVLPHMANSFHNLHGGAMATLVDVWTSAVLSLADPTSYSVSINLSMDYISSVPIHSNILITSKVLYAGKSIQFANCSIHHILPNKLKKLVAKGTHIKKIISSSNNHPRSKL